MQSRKLKKSKKSRETVMIRKEIARVIYNMKNGQLIDFVFNNKKRRAVATTMRVYDLDRVIVTEY